MKFTLNPTEYKIWEIISNNDGSCKTKHIVETYQKQFSRTTKQSLYRTIKSLRSKEAITTQKGITSINTHWLYALGSKIEIVKNKISHTEIPENSQFTFSSVWQGAPALTHYINNLIAQTPKTTPIIFINPHQWFYVARKQSEELLINHIESEGYTLWQGITHKNKVNTHVLQTYFRDRPRIKGSYVEPFKGEEYTYVNVYQDFVVYLNIDAHITAAMGKWYAECDVLSPEKVDELRRILKMPGKITIKITKNKAKAEKYRRLMGRYIADTNSK